MIHKMDLITILILFGLSGCSSKTSVVPALDGQPRVPVNSTVSSVHEAQSQQIN